MISASSFVVDTCTLEGNRITRVFVLPVEQGKGYGPRMMSALERAVKRVLAETICLHAILAFELANCLANCVEYNVFNRC